MHLLVKVATTTIDIPLIGGFVKQFFGIDRIDLTFLISFLLTLSPYPLYVVCSSVANTTHNLPQIITGKPPTVLNPASLRAHMQMALQRKSRSADGQGEESTNWFQEEMGEQYYSIACVEPGLQPAITHTVQSRHLEWLCGLAASMGQLPPRTCVWSAPLGNCLTVGIID